MRGTVFLKALVKYDKFLTHKSSKTLDTVQGTRKSVFQLLDSAEGDEYWKPNWVEEGESILGDIKQLISKNGWPENKAYQAMTHLRTALSKLEEDDRDPDVTLAERRMAARIRNATENFQTPQSEPRATAIEILSATGRSLDTQG